MWKKLMTLLQKIKCKINCCYESQCSLNDENKIDEDSIDENKIVESSAF